MIKLESGTSHLFIETVTEMNLGTTLGQVTVDRPTQKDSQYNLPIIPDSAIKGVMKDSYGGADADELFGTSDDPDKGTFGKSGALLFGCAQLFCFPVLIEKYRLFVMPIVSLFDYLNLKPSQKDTFIEILRICFRSEQRKKKGHAIYFGTHTIHAMSDAVDFEVLDYNWAEEKWMNFFFDLDTLIDSSNDGLILAGPLAASALWQTCADYRAATAIETHSKSASDGSLRRVELIPASSLFYGTVTNGLNRQIDNLPDRLQLGGSESTGWGWCRFKSIPIRIEKDYLFEGSVSPIEESSIMHKTFGSVSKLKELLGFSEEKKRIRSILRQFGGRVQSFGFEKTIALSLAKAKCKEKKNTGEPFAHRWVLAALYTIECPTEKEADFISLLDLITQKLIDHTLENYSFLAMHYWQWLNKFAEIELD